MQPAQLIAVRRRAAGFTLISTLVGIAVGLIGIAAMLTLYRNLVTEARSINEQSMRDGQIATGSLAAQQEMQQAGFGITGATVGTDLVVLSNATLTNGKLKGTALTSYSAAANGNAVIWGFNPTAATGTIDPAGYMCEGLIVTSNGLQLLPPTSCKSAANWQSVTWKPQQLAATGYLGPLSMFQANAGSCWPYQSQAASTGSTLQLSYYLPTKDQQDHGQTNLPGGSSDSSSSSGSSGDGSIHSDNGKGNDYGASKGKSNGGSGSGSSGDASGSSGSNGSSGSSGDNPASSSSSEFSSSSAVTNVPTFSVCLPNFQQQGTH
ncbi:prepilin-type N-terminal cleavage/methylation domain-containing protein [Dyella sp.]|uniref:PilW family protein n=1 Tax=Dyella sp. TaxID=1869338 RepID=UPI002B48C3DD|nr:prepilin-type N-terminal cleavage/methylation domain-containing protein [Dyella sp.]HKT26597.1 prepilin-type N-terminal cleavage/methylation domain-containing protein [Dyella sp.]